MDAILRSFKWRRKGGKNIGMCYLDNVVIFRRTFSAHNSQLYIVLNCIRSAGLVLNSKKCHFGERQTLVLRHLVDKDGIRPDPQKTTAVEAFFSTPRSVKELPQCPGALLVFPSLYS